MKIPASFIIIRMFQYFIDDTTLENAHNCKRNL